MFEKGNTLGPGRPKGSVSIDRIEKQNLVNFLKEEGADKFIEHMKELKPKDYCKYYVPVVELAFPKLARYEHTGRDGADLFPKPLMDVRNNIGNDQNKELNQTNPGNPGGNIGIEDGIDNPLPDSISTD